MWIPDYFIGLKSFSHRLNLTTNATHVHRYHPHLALKPGKISEEDQTQRRHIGVFFVALCNSRRMFLNQILFNLYISLELQPNFHVLQNELVLSFSEKGDHALPNLRRCWPA